MVVLNDPATTVVGMKAMETGKDADINEATRCLQVALNQENWWKG